MSEKKGYPTSKPAPAPAAYPPGPMYPSAPPAQGAYGGYPPAQGPQPGYPQGAQPGYPPQGHPQGPPPPYSPYPQGGMHPQGPPPPPQQHYIQPQQTVVVQGAFDAGARFGAGAQPNIPPPPPGCAPNAAQMAQMQGHNVVATQRQGNFMTGGSDGGYTIW